MTLGHDEDSLPKEHKEVSFKETLMINVSDTFCPLSRQLAFESSKPKLGDMGIGGPFIRRPMTCKHTLSLHVFRQLLGNYTCKRPSN